jgi:hypothetical protein
MQKSKAVLPVAYTFKNGENASSSEDWAEPPLTANEYLARVRREAEAIPDLMFAETSVPSSSAASSSEEMAVPLTVGSVADSSVTPVPSNDSESQPMDSSQSMEQRPLEEAHGAWQEQTLAQFVQLRNALANRRAAMDESGDDNELGRCYNVPQLRAAVDWHYFCFGLAAPRSLGSSEGRVSAGEASVAQEEEEAPIETGSGDTADDDAMLLGSSEHADGGELESWEREAAAEKASTNASEEANAAAIAASTLDVDSAARTTSPASTGTSTDAAKEEVDWSNGGVGNAPTVRLLLQLDAGTASTRVFAHHVRWLTYDVEAQRAAAAAASVAADGQGGGANDEGRGGALSAAAAASSAVASVPLVNRGRWLYALLARLPDPCHRDTLSDVRTLYRTCAAAYGRLRDDQPEELSAKQALAVLLLIAGRHFNQAPLS